MPEEIMIIGGQPCQPDLRWRTTLRGGRVLTCYGLRFNHNIPSLGSLLIHALSQETEGGFLFAHKGLTNVVEECKINFIGVCFNNKKVKGAQTVFVS
jgi:hypothetical protein